MTINFVSAFAGIGGFERGFELAGNFECISQIEWKKDRTRVLEERWPLVPRFGDIKEVTGADIISAGGRPDVVVGGFPCFAGGTLITAKDGLRPIEDLVVGDLVLTHERRWRQVTSTMSREAQQIVELRFLGAPSLVTTDEHPFWVRTKSSRWDASRGSYRREWDAPHWAKAGDLTKDDFIGMPLDEETSDAPLSIDEARLVGRWLGDGWIVNCRRTEPGRNGHIWKAVICCDPSEETEVERLIAAAGYHATRAPDRTATKYHISSKALVQRLEPFGRGALHKKVPAWCFVMPIAAQAALLEGWLSADGNARRDGRDVKGGTSSEQLAIGMARIARNVRQQAVSLFTTKRPPTCVIEGRTVNQHDTYDVVIHNRNREAFTEHGFVWVPVRSVDVINRPTTVFNISVEEDESYVAAGAAVHNCQDTSIAAPHRVGLEGERSGHFWSFARLLAELAELLDELDPRLVVIENVPGLLRSNDGADMDRVLATMVELGYGVAWRCLDSASIGGGQRRQRLLVVGHRGDDPVPAAQVLALAGRGSEDSGLDHPRRSSARRPKVARGAEEYGGRLMFRKSRRPRSKTDYATYIQDDVINTLNGFDTGFSSRQTNLVIDQGKVRVLTLEEWEAAQGFDTGWTAPMDKDGLRFSAIGDSMNVHLARWLGERIAALFAELPMIGAST